VIDLEPAFGKPGRIAAAWNPVIVIRHGFASSDVPFQGLAAFLAQRFPNASIDNATYPWRDSVLVNGARLAHDISGNAAYAGRDLILIGHSMGGLVARVASTALTDLNFSAVVAMSGPSLGYSTADVQDIKNLAFGPASLRPVCGIVTLATPNSGAMLHGQVSGVSALLHAALNIFPSTQTASVADLTTDRLFRLLQHLRSDAKVLSVSGSRWSRFATASGQVSSWLGLGGIQLEMPHDAVVEDRSVDLNESILPNEIVHNGRSPYVHLRVYEDCTSVTHTNIYDRDQVREHIVDMLTRC
jgi:pimeloyl-ACP methyl ester carboxylesterase